MPFLSKHSARQHMAHNEHSQRKRRSTRVVQPPQDPRVALIFVRTGFSRGRPSRFPTFRIHGGMTSPGAMSQGLVDTQAVEHRFHGKHKM